MLTPSPRVGAVSRLVQCFAIPVHTKTGLKYVLMNVCLLPALSPILASNFTL